jgi:hypothetical protein
LRGLEKIGTEKEKITAKPWVQYARFLVEHQKEAGSNRIYLLVFCPYEVAFLFSTQGGSCYMISTLWHQNRGLALLAFLAILTVGVMLTLWYLGVLHTLTGPIHLAGRAWNAPIAGWAWNAPIA